MLKKMVKSRDLELVKAVKNKEEHVAKLKAEIEVKALEINELKAKVIYFDFQFNFVVIFSISNLKHF